MSGYAAKWINQYDGLDNVIAHADEITGKKGEALREHLGDVIRNRRLNALVCDLDLEKVPGGPPAAGVGPPGGPGRCSTSWSSGASCGPGSIDVLAPEEEPEVEGGFELDGTTLGPGRRRQRGSRRLGTERVGLHVRGTWGSGTGRVLGVGLALADGRAAYVDVEAMSPADDAALAGWLADPARPKVLHDAKGPMLALAAHGWTLVGVAEDTALAAYLVSPDQRSYDLADLTLRYLHRELQQEGDGDQGMLFDEDGTRRAVRDGARPGGARPVRGARRPGRARRRPPTARRDRAAAGRRPGAAWSRPASRSTSTTSSRWSGTSASR